MQISGIGQSGFSLQQAPVVQAQRSEEAGEVASGPAEEARESGTLVKSAEQDRGLGTMVDVLA
jgi:hypothetical protein